MHRNDFDTFDELVRGKLSGYTEPPEMESLNRIHVKKARVASLYQLYRLFAVLLVAGLGMFASTLLIQQKSDGETSINIIQNEVSTPSVEETERSSIIPAEFASAVSVNASTNSSTPIVPAVGSSSQSGTKTSNNPASIGSEKQSRTRQSNNPANTPAKRINKSTSSNNRTTTTPHPNSLIVPAPGTAAQPVVPPTQPTQEGQDPETNLHASDSMSMDSRKNETCDIAFNFYGSYTGALTFYSTLPFSSSSQLTWDFGDGKTSNELSPSHQYERPGTYQVTLTLNNQGKQCRATASKEIVMNGQAEPHKAITLSGSLLAGNDLVSNGVIEVYEFNTRSSKYMSTLTVRTQNDGSFTLPITEGVQYLIKGYPSSAYANYKPTFWGNTTSNEDASEIVITPGEKLDLLGYNIQLLVNEQTLPELTPVDLPIANSGNQIILVDANNNVVGMGHVDQNGNIVANEGTKAGNYLAVNPSTGKTSPVEVSSSGTVAAVGSNIPSNPEQVSVFPNPVNDLVNFGVNSDEREEAILVVMNAAGFELMRKSILFTPGFNQLQYNISEFSPGIYYVMVFKGNQQVMSNRIVKTGELSK